MVATSESRGDDETCMYDDNTWYCTARCKSRSCQFASTTLTDQISFNSLAFEVKWEDVTRLRLDCRPAGRVCCNWPWRCSRLTLRGTKRIQKNQQRGVFRSIGTALSMHICILTVRDFLALALGPWSPMVSVCVGLLVCLFLFRCKNPD